MLPSVRPFLSRSLYPTFSRAAQIMEKKPNDVVITFAKRTAIGRAKKGQLKDIPVDEMMYALLKVRLLAERASIPLYVLFHRLLFSK